jgi:DNA topoisomerase I
LPRTTKLREPITDPTESPNTPSVCRKCYVHPEVLDCYMSGAIIKTMKQQVETESDGQSLRQEEVALLKLLQQRLALAAA